jgi:hypothetical protein
MWDKLTLRTHFLKRMKLQLDVAGGTQVQQGTGKACLLQTEQTPPEYPKQTAVAAEKRRAAGPNHLNALREGPIEYRSKASYRL